MTKTMISPPFEVWSINSTNSKPLLTFQTINNETWTTLQACPTIYKSNPGKSIPLEMTTSYLNRPETTCSNNDTTCFPSDSQLWSFMTLFMARVGSAAWVITGKWQQKHNDTTTQQNKVVTVTRNIYSNPSRIQSTNIYSNPSRIQSNIPKPN